jgi:hypothetical protein
VLERIRGARVGRKTALVVLLVALALWATLTYVRVRDFVPAEFREPTPEARP